MGGNVHFRHRAKLADIFDEVRSAEVVVHNRAAEFCHISPHSDFLTQSHHSHDCIVWWDMWRCAHRDPHLREFAVFLGRNQELEHGVDISAEDSVIINEAISTFAAIIFSSDTRYDKTWKLRRLLRYLCMLQRTSFHSRWSTAEKKNSSHHMEILTNFIQRHVYIKYLNVSTFHRDSRTLGWFRHAMKVVLSSKDLAYGELHETSHGSRPNGYIYQFFDTESSNAYIGKVFSGATSRSPAKRYFGEHVRHVCSPKTKSSASNWLPCYDEMRKRGMWNAVHFTLCTVPDTTNERLRYHEKFFIHTFQPSLNTPYIYRNQQDRVQIGEPKTRQPQSYRTLGRFRDAQHVPFENAPLVKSMSPIAHDVAERLGDGKRRYDDLAKKIVKFPLHTQKKIFHLVNTHLFGRSRAIALWRMKNIITFPFRTHVKLQIPHITQFPLQKMIAHHVRKQICGPVVIAMEKQMSPTISTVLQNQKFWNKNIDTVHPCTCTQLFGRFNFPRSEEGHVCLPFSQLGIVEPYTSLQSRVLPDASRVTASLRGFFIAFFHRNRGLFRCTNLRNFTSPIDSWIDKYAASWDKFMGFPKEAVLRAWSEQVGQLAVITRQVDKNRHDLVVSCPFFYYLRMRKLFLENRIYREITDLEVADIETKLRGLLISLNVIGLSTKLRFDTGAHAYGTASIWHKFSDILRKDRPLVSYYEHIGRDVFSAFGRAAVWFITQVVRDHICVFSAQAVASNFNDFSAQINFDRPFSNTNAHIYGFKFDIDNFFPNIPKSLLRDSWRWIFQLKDNDYGRGGTARYQYIHVPKRQGRKGVKVCNEFFIKFGEFCQKRGYKNKLRRLYKETPKPLFSTHRVPPKDYISVKISDFFAATLADLDTSIVYFGKIPLLTLDGSPQGSPLSMSNATAVAVYLEARNWNSIFDRLVQVLNASYLKIMRQRWVDDLYLTLACDQPLSETQKSFIRTIMNEMYTPFSLKVEDEAKFVGFSPDFADGRIRYTISTRAVGEMVSSGRPLFVHSRTNNCVRQVEGTITGAILRCLDCSSDSELCLFALRKTLTELCLLRFAPKIFMKCLFKLEKRYEIMKVFIAGFRSTLV